MLLEAIELIYKTALGSENALFAPTMCLVAGVFGHKMERITPKQTNVPLVVPYLNPALLSTFKSMFFKSTPPFGEKNSAPSDDT